MTTDVNYVVKLPKGPNNDDYEIHECKADCVAFEEVVLQSVPGAKKTPDSILVDNLSLYYVPILCGWRYSAEPQPLYTAPCGHVCTSLEDVHAFLDRSNSSLSVDQFVFDGITRLFTKRHPLKVFKHVPDVTKGLENVPVNLVDELDDTGQIPQFEYITERVSSSVTLNGGFTCCCSCVDDCRDAEKCECQQLTKQERGRWKIPSIIKWNKGYHFKQLKHVGFNAIYECHQRCSCSQKCLNKVVSNGIKLFLEVFKTSTKGWGLRCLHDIPQGTFVCSYSGEVFTDSEAEKLGKERGDEYFTDLNYIEEIEDLVKTCKYEKEDYESDVDLLTESDKSGSTDESSSESESDIESDFSAEEPSVNQTASISSPNGVLSDHCDEVKENEPPSKKPKMDLNSSEQQTEAIKSLRSYFADPEPYVIDAKYKGNIGRFLNHSCSPNCKIQTIFVDHLDPRVPVLAFFTTKPVKAFTELTWNYSYVSNSRSDENLCKCESQYCKQVKF